ncbi:hypothetical protein R3W88_011836 [Solanum pinnatisectum]|uniref:Uncharacterized protein n=1 Tax=Solanum pinnatisectum TaxID=50273 RepID=A0AAV9L8L6_9SOLN|nr:hypothetical protein R3W88_011836 [Solanum pinnatisectum]
MDLMLGVAELHTQEAISAAESAIASYQPVIDLDTNDTTDSEDSSYEDDIEDSSTKRSDDDDDDDDGGSSLGKESKLTEKGSPKKALKRKRQSVNRANIVERS